ncbi:hypothetical protein CEXT_384781 [Caerostris extrusa]|uniref:Uncharacterized protein n=1 Tax=Caerostris extrusa TaxID=172846 RepID=A0AAV4RVV2_CAEEX|nr:hypothetical protein CEXT_384781 [Caerostris extrusa]
MRRFVYMSVLLHPRFFVWAFVGGRGRSALQVPRVFPGLHPEEQPPAPQEDAHRRPGQVPLHSVRQRLLAQGQPQVPRENDARIIAASVIGYFGSFSFQKLEGKTYEMCTYRLL